MRQYQIRITELAEEDLENAGDYIAYELKNSSAAKKYSKRDSCKDKFSGKLSGEE